MIGHRVALALFVALLVAAAAPLAYAWAKLLPEEPSPFQMHPERRAVTDEEELEHSRGRRNRDPFAIFLLVCVTASYLLKFPGMPVGAGLQVLSRGVPPDYFDWVVMAGRAFFVVVPGLAAAYSVVRANPIRISLALAGLLVLALWLANPYLIAALGV